MAVPFRRTSKTRKRMRRTHFKLGVPGLVTCPHCGALIPAHTVCPKCGYYKGEKVIGPVEETSAAPKAKATKGKKKAGDKKVAETSTVAEEKAE